MALISDMKDKMEDMNIARMQKMFRDLRAKDKAGTITTSEREHLARLRERMGL